MKTSKLESLVRYVEANSGGNITYMRYLHEITELYQLEDKTWKVSFVVRDRHSDKHKWELGVRIKDYPYTYIIYDHLIYETDEELFRLQTKLEKEKIKRAINAL